MKKKIVFLDTVGTPFNGDTLKKRGLGGSESATIYMARELAKIGFDVTVICNLEVKYNKEERILYDGVGYWDLTSAKFWKEPVDILISLRSVLPFVHPDNAEYAKQAGWDRENSKALVECAKHKIVWAHDYFIHGQDKLEYMLTDQTFNEVFTLSDYHTTYISNYCWNGKGTRPRHYEVIQKYIWQTRNGVEKYVDEVDIPGKDPNLFVYNTSFPKGMKPLCEKVWPAVKKEFPEAKLMIMGGTYKLNDSGDMAYGDDYDDLVNRFSNRDGIMFTGLITPKEVAETLAKASFVIYPTAFFPETYGISIVEALTYNTPVIGCRYGAMAETAIDRMCYMSDFSYELGRGEAYQAVRHGKFMDQVRLAYNDNYLKQQKMYACNEVDGLLGWDTVALQWKQHFCKVLDLYMPQNELIEANRINKGVAKLFGRRILNPEDKAIYIEPENKQNRIIVVTPVYNADNYIEKCIRSVANQMYSNYRMVIVDDNSTDRTFETATHVIASLPKGIRDKFELIHNGKRKGALSNQVEILRKHAYLRGDYEPTDINVLLDGDDWLVNDSEIFGFLNDLYNEGTEMSYGSCHSLADNMDLIAQPYPSKVHNNKSYREHLFNWGMPYTHLRTFERSLYSKIDQKLLKDENGEFYKAGGDNALFYALIEECQPENVKCVQRVIYVYNDKNPLADRFVNPELQNENAKKIREQKPTKIADIEEFFTDSVEQPKGSPILDTFETVLDSQKKKGSSKINGLTPSSAVDTSVPTFTLKEIANKKVLIAMPVSRASGDDVHAKSAKSITQMVCGMFNEGKNSDLEIYFEQFHTYSIAQNRNYISSYALKNGVDFLLMVDSDIMVPRNTLQLLIEDNVDIVGGLYRQKANNIPEVYIDHQRATMTQINKNAKRLVETSGIGMGCILISAKVLKAIGYPWFEYHEKEGGVELSEDYDFCLKAIRKGFRIYLDKDVRCKHLFEIELEP